ncbi:extracellular solute-binding protein [Microbacterium soli]|uniref:ABC transporter substrate-binding protein n=1 Tax=Microbacterium soli TaxID=446075 RepID=A0ABP7MX50_9MICO
MEMQNRAFAQSTVLTRRSLLTAAGLAVLGGAAGLSLVGCSPASGGGTSKGRVVYAGFGGTFDDLVKKNFFDPFTEETGFPVVMTGDSPPPVGPIQAGVEAESPDWNILILNSSGLALCLANDLLQDLDYSKIPGAADYADPSYKHPKGAGMWAFGDVLWSNTAVFGDPLEKWEDLWDVKAFPGKRGFLNQAHKTFEATALGMGIEPADLYPMDMDLIFERLDEIRPHAVFLDINTINNQLSQQDIVAGPLNIIRVRQAVLDGIPVGYTWNEHLVDVNYYGIPRHAKDLDAASALIDYMTSPEVQARVAEALSYTPATKAAQAAIDEETAANLPASEVTDSQALHISADWWAENGVEAEKRFSDWLQKG